VKHGPPRGSAAPAAAFGTNPAALSLLRNTSAFDNGAEGVSYKAINHMGICSGCAVE
jgi:hypothetical protein